MQVVERATYAIHDQTTSDHITWRTPTTGADNKLWIDDLMMIHVALLQKNNKDLETTQTKIFQNKQYKTSTL